MTILDDYRPCTLCNPPVDCIYRGIASEPCYGEVLGEDTEEGIVHYCRGHVINDYFPRTTETVEERV
jgi:hypothetical protein